MTADQRLDQLEPLLSEALTVLDRHTFQLKQLNSAVSHITNVLVQQSDNISFLLQEHIVIKEDIAEMKADISGLKTDVADLKIDVAGMKAGVSGLKTDVAGMKTDIASLKTDVAEIRHSQQAMQAEFGNKLDLILAKLP